MAPDQSFDDWPAAVPKDYDQFFADLQVFHNERGTTLDVNAKVNGKHIDLYKLFEVIHRRGGYDVVSSEKLAWRKISQEFSLGQQNAAAYAFALKTTYYKNLAAYAIKRVHNQEPPPKEILENITAKGSDLLHRTVENFRASRENANGQDSEVSDDDVRNTPKAEKMDVDEPISGGRTRGLRQTPAQRVFFQPDVSSSRQPRQISNPYNSPQPQSNMNAGHVPNPAASMSYGIQNFEHRGPQPLAIRPLATPGTNPTFFKDKAKRVREEYLIQSGRTPPHRAIMLPGTGFDGPNIYVRTLLALRSGIPQEQDYALHHLVKISHERGDKYKFEAFPGLSEALVEKALEMSSLFYDVNWEICYVDDGAPKPDNFLDGMNGTPDILDRMSRLTPLQVSDDLRTPQFSRTLDKSHEAGLILRNMSMLEENARYLADQCPLRDFLTIALNLPKNDCVVELKHCALDIAEQLTKYWILESNDPLYVTLLKYINDGKDRGAALTALRAIGRISMNLEASNRLRDIPLSTISLLIEWTFLDDDDLVSACLDFFYQYTAVPENVAFLLANMQNGLISLHPLVKQCGQLLLHGAQDFHSNRPLAPAIPEKPAKDIPRVPSDLLTQIMEFSEPERSSMWLKAAFEESNESEITQIALWQAYQTTFSPLCTPTRTLLAAADFIKNVSTTFPQANAQVIGPNGPSPRFIIKGIQPRRIPVDPKGRAYMPCLWSAPGSFSSCDTFHSAAAPLWEHIVSDHLGLTSNEAKQWDVTALRQKAAEHGQRFDCHWGRCQHFISTNGTDDPLAAGLHIRTHLPDVSAKAEQRAKSNRVARPKQQPGDVDLVINGQAHPAEVFPFNWQETPFDMEVKDAAGISLASALVLRNLARTVPKAIVGFMPASCTPWMDDLFSPIRTRLFHVLSNNHALSHYVADLIETIEAGQAKA